MRKGLVIFFIFSMIGISCNSNIEKPDNLIEKDDMANILADMMLLEATYNTRLIMLSDKNERMTRFSNEVLMHHNVSGKNFNDSYDYYLNNNDEFEEILELVFEELNKMETEASKYNEIDPTKDSTLIVE